MWPNAPHTRTTQVVSRGLNHPVSGLCPQVQLHAAVSAGTSPLQVLLCHPLPQVWPMPFPPQWSESPLRICLLRKAVTFLLGLQESRAAARWAGAGGKWWLLTPCALQLCLLCSPLHVFLAVLCWNPVSATWTLLLQEALGKRVGTGQNFEMI